MTRAADQLGAGAIEEYRECGWTITPYGRPDAGVTTGPCGRCRQPTLLYGPRGAGLCVDCGTGSRTWLGGAWKGGAGCGLAGHGRDNETAAPQHKATEPPTTRSIA